MARPLLSVVMPCLNGMPWIREAIASATAHLDSLAYEIVVADGGSTDGTVELLRGTDALVLAGPDRSLYDGLNRAVAAASGEFIIWLNADDRLCAGVRDLVRLADDRNADMVTGDARIVLPAGAVRPVSNGAGPMNAESILFGVATINCRVIRRDIVERTGGFSTELGLAADREALLRLKAHAPRRFHLPATIYEYRSHPRSRTIGGTWSSYSRVHQANLQLADALGAEDAETTESIEKLRLVSSLALARSEMARGRAHSALMALREGWKVKHKVKSGLAAHRKHRALGSGW